MKYRPFHILAIPCVVTGLGAHLWSNTWYITVVAAFCIWLAADTNPFKKKITGAVIMILAIWGLYKFPFVSYQTQVVFGKIAMVYLSTFFFGNIIANYFNQGGIFTGRQTLVT